MAESQPPCATPQTLPHPHPLSHSLSGAVSEDVHLSLLCRVCGQTSIHFIPIFEGEGLENNLSTKINSYLPLQVNVNDELPLQLCFQCASALVTWHNLYQCCLQTNVTLNSKLSKTQMYNDASNPSRLNLEESSSNQNRYPHYRPSFHTYDLAQNSKNCSVFKEEMTLDTEESVQSLQLANLCKSIKSEMPNNYYSSKDTESEKDDIEIFKLISFICDKFKNLIFKKDTSIVNNMKFIFPDNFFKDLYKLFFEMRYTILNKNILNSENSPKEHSDVNNDIEPMYDDYEDNDTCTIDQNNRNIKTKRKLTEDYKRIDRNVSVDIIKAKITVNGRIFYICPICKRSLRTADGFICHLRIHSGEKPCICHLCGKQFRINTGLQRHLKETHQKVKNFSCETCDQKFVNKQNLIQHRRIHTGERPYVCTKCGKGFKQSASLHIHSKIHTDNYPFICASCNAKFRSKAQLIHHIYKHTGEKPNVCDVCGRAFRIKHDLNNHKLIHSEEKPFSCVDCGMSFRQKRYLRNHCKKSHSTPGNDT